MLLDTCFVRFAIEGKSQARELLFKEGPELFISTITVGEIIHGTAPNDCKIVQSFLKQFHILDLSFEIAVLAGQILQSRQTQIITRRGNKIKKIGDFYIAATALHHNLPILTHNFRDFRKLKKLPGISDLKIKEFKI